MKIWIYKEDNPILDTYEHETFGLFFGEVLAEVSADWFKDYKETDRKFWDYQDTLDQIWSAGRKPTGRTPEKIAPDGYPWTEYTSGKSPKKKPAPKKRKK